MITLKIGGQSVEIQKSTTHLALRPSPRHEGALASVLGGRGDLHLMGRGLGGFDLFRAAEEVCAEDTLEALRALPEVAVASHVYTFADNGTPLVPTGELFFVFRENAPHKSCLALLREHQLQIAEIRGKREIIARTTFLSPNPVKLAIELQARNELVETCEPNLSYPLVHGRTPAPFPGAGPATGHPGGGSEGEPSPMDAAGIRDAWGYLGHRGSPSLVVAVVDQGFELPHPDLGGSLHAPFDFERYADDERWQHSGEPFGTRAAELAVGTDPGDGRTGAAPGARFMPVRLHGIDDQVVEQLCDHLIDQGADVVCLAWGIPGRVLSTRIRKALSKLAAQGRCGRGTVVVVAAGDTGDRISGLAEHPEVVCVGACKDSGRCAEESNTGPALSVLAPVRDSDRFGAAAAGSAAAAALAAGVCTLVLSANPELTAAQVGMVLRSSADRVGPPDEYAAQGRSDRYGHGRINAFRAVAMAKGLIGTGHWPLVGQPTICLRGSAKAVLAPEQAGRLFQTTLGSQLIIQATPKRAGLDLEMFLRKEGIPQPHAMLFDKRSSFQSGVDFIVENGIVPTDYYLLLRAASSMGEYSLQISLGGSGRTLEPTETAPFGGCHPVRLQYLGQTGFSRTGETHLYRLGLKPLMTVGLKAEEGSAGSLELYLRRGELPDPKERLYDLAAMGTDKEDGRIQLESDAPVPSDCFFLVRGQSSGAGECTLELQLGQ
jgi:hypothetical protein